MLGYESRYFSFDHVQALNEEFEIFYLQQSIDLEFSKKNVYSIV